MFNCQNAKFTIAMSTSNRLISSHILIGLLSIAVVYSQTTSYISQLRQLANGCPQPTKCYDKRDIAKNLIKNSLYKTFAVTYLMHFYYSKGWDDSVKSLLDRFPDYEKYPDLEYIKQFYPNNLLPLMVHPDSSLLNESSQKETDITMGLTYYHAFTEVCKMKLSEDLAVSYAQNALKFLEPIYNSHRIYKQVLKYPLLQIATFLGDTKRIKTYESASYDTVFYFPVRAFMRLPRDWRHNCSYNLVNLNTLPNPMAPIHETFVGLDYALSTLKRYSRHVRAMEEPPLLTIKHDVFRFIWLRTFHNPIIVRIELREDSSVFLTWKKTSGRGGYAPGRLVLSIRKELSLKEWNQFLKLIEQSKFWELESVELTYGLDGAQWILEGKINNKYHLVDQWSPRDNSTFKQACLYLLKLTNLEIPEDEIY